MARDTRYDLTDEEREAQNQLVEELNREEVDPDSGELGEHPEGAKRGGYVPIYEGENGARAFYCTTAEEWCPYDG